MGNVPLSIPKRYGDLHERMESGPGLPVSNPTKSFWQNVPSPIASYKPERLPECVDVAIIGSGITGASVARTLMQKGGEELKVAMLEARDACSGATGRNGGHIFPPLFEDYVEMKKKYGRDEAEKFVRLRLQHIQELIDVAKEEGVLEETQAREVEGLDVYLDLEAYKENVAKFKKWAAEMPEEAKGITCTDGKDAIEKYRLSSHVQGVISNHAGAIHPYRFVTTILSRLLEKYKGRFELATHTPCIYITHSDADNSYTVLTPSATIRATHVVHATNAWAAHLLPSLREKILAVRATMSAQRPGSSIGQSTLDGARSWIFYDEGFAYDYLTQLPSGGHELMFGGGLGTVGYAMMDELGNTDDAGVNRNVCAHLSGALPVLFGEANWGKEAIPSEEENDDDDDRWLPGRVKAIWSGVIGMSVDEVPWVGRVPTKIAGRSAPGSIADNLSTGLAPPGEWICAGYSGEGMGHAFLCGRALAYQVLNKEMETESWFPTFMNMTEKRWNEASVDEFIRKFTQNESCMLLPFFTFHKITDSHPIPYPFFRKEREKGRCPRVKRYASFRSI